MPETMCFLPERTYKTIAGVRLTERYGSVCAKAVDLPYYIIEFDGQPVINVICGTGGVVSLLVNSLIEAFQQDAPSVRAAVWESLDRDGYGFYFRGLSLVAALEAYTAWHPL